MDEPAPAGQQGHEELLTKLSLADKISLLTGADYWHLRAHPRIGLRRIRTSDGPAGVRGPRWDERDTAVNVPAPVAVAATWDPRRAELIGSLLAAECRRQDVDVLLAPTVNLQRSPFGGRNFEFFGEDPLLTAAELTAGQQPGQRGQDCPISPRRLRRRDLALEHGDLVAQDQDLGVLGPVGPGEQGEPAEYA